MAMKNPTRSSYARVRVEVDLLKEFPKRINMGVRNKIGKVREKQININYDYVPKYYKSCKIQGHNEHQCYVLHPELYPKKSLKENEKEGKGANKGKGDGEKGQEEETGKAKEQKDKTDKQKGGQSDKTKHMGNRRGLIQQTTVVGINNQFEALKKKQNEEEKQVQGKSDPIVVTKEWVLDKFKKREGIDNQKENGKKVDDNNDKQQINEGMQEGKVIYDFSSANMDQEQVNIKRSEPTKEGTQEEKVVQDLGSANKDQEHATILGSQDSVHYERVEKSDPNGLRYPPYYDQDPNQNREAIENIKDNIVENTNHIIIEGDLSPRQEDGLKSGAKRQQNMLLLQVKTKSSRDKTSYINQ